MCFRVINTLRKENTQPEGRREITMKHTLEQVYTREAQLERAYAAAKAAGDEAGMEKARDAYHEMEDEILKTEDNDFGFAFRLYKQMKECDPDLMVQRPSKCDDRPGKCDVQGQVWRSGIFILYRETDSVRAVKRCAVGHIYNTCR
jgi:hypothetical protein